MTQTMVTNTTIATEEVTEETTLQHKSTSTSLIHPPLGDIINTISSDFSGRRSTSSIRKRHLRSI